ncbi:hypothetical protein CkaCkLH20_00719 [Colletotrichum karsti]|uniref:Uncharacterized protein n=1 Tax=Colletotrichum karsti TaxID=1095194 RepID=A0A9P6IDI3_9PEZI|nr:uncharacterized protein CkaCkLH20_00719 [Colletotrichum karsti]KAF9881573.1 hypothetical protein CkaCkLH20_00719 [Colletotrichum karsti]
MGLLKFFSSKKSAEKAANDIKAQAYDATTASLPPLLGTYPVAGNGPTNVFEDLQRSHHKMSETNLSLAAGSEASAPAPPAPRFRDASVERPSSAPNGAGPDVMRSGPSWRESQDGSTKSHESTWVKNKLDEIFEHVPVRTSSLRHWSISSATPTMSSSSSFQRPQSRHTATTSVDLATMSSFMNDSCDSLHSGTGGHTSFCTALESAVPSPLDSSAPGASFNIDDYLSSDDDVDADSFITTRRRDSGLGATNEEELLFSDNGYGEGGLQLPGLFDSLTAIPEPTFASPSRLSMRHSHSGPVHFQRKLSLDPRVEAPIFSLDEDDYEPGDYDILPARADLALGRRGTRRISAIGIHQSIEEEREEKVDVRTAVRLRKEAKAKQRAMARLSRVQNRRAVADEEAHPSDRE